MTLLELLVKATLLLAVSAAAHGLIARRTSAASRHLLWTVTIAGLLVLPGSLLVAPGWTAVRVAAPVIDSTTAVGGVVTTMTQSLATSQQSLSTAASAAGPDRVATAMIGYGAVTFLLLCRLFVDRQQARRFVRRLARVTDSNWTALLTAAAARVGVQRPVTLLWSTHETMPMTLGTWQPAIVLPPSAAAWPEDQRRSVLLHELSHVARHDCLTQTCGAVACALYWMHPGVWWVAARLRTEREFACDDCVVAAGADAHDYAGYLLDAAQRLGLRPPAPAVTMAAAGHLERRLRALMDNGRHRALVNHRQRLAMVGAMMAAVFAIGGASADGGPAAARGARTPERLLAIQEPPGEAFETASVKPNKSTGTGGFIQRRPGGNFAVGNQTLRTLIAFAYQLQGFQLALVNAPDWTATERFDIVAKAGRDLPITPLGTISHEALMLRSLLEDRFQLRVHRETREMPVYALIVARPDRRLGPQLRRPVGDHCAQRYQAAQKGAVVESSPTDPVCGIRGDGNTLTAGSFPLNEFARLLSGQVSRIVIDRTGLDGQWDFELKFSRPDSQPQDPDHPVIFTALEEQLGLKLDSTTGPVEVLVVDHVERPSPD